MDKDFSSKSFKSSPPSSKKTPRGLVVVLFLTTVGLSLFFWGKPQFKDWWESLWQPAIYEIVNPDIVDEQLIRISQNLYSPKDVVEGIEELVDPLQGTYGVYIESLENGTQYGINQEVEFIAASVNKVLIMAKVLKEIEEGRLDLEDEYRLQKKDIQDYGTGSMRYDRVGTSYTLDELLSLAGKKSDNTAAWVLNLMVGKKGVSDFISELRMEKTSMEDNLTTPAEMGRFFGQIYRGKILADDLREKFYSYLTRTELEDRIPAGVPSFVSVAHKIGNELQTINDCGIVFDKKHPYVLCIFSKKAKESEALELLPKISALVWTYESKQE